MGDNGEDSVGDGVDQTVVWVFVDIQAQGVRLEFVAAADVVVEVGEEQGQVVGLEGGEVLQKFRR